MESNGHYVYRCKFFSFHIPEMVGWHDQPDGHEVEQAPRAGDGQGSQACCSPWDYKESYMTE